MAIFTGKGVPVDSAAYWLTQGLVNALTVPDPGPALYSRAFFLREDGAIAGPNTMMYMTANGGATWTAAAL
jgi:photosystem II stability/assembly factor-like uncharacterized protein